MNQKGFSSILVVILALVIIGGIAGYFVFFLKQEPAPSPTPTPATPSLSADKKSIVASDKILLAIDNDTIFNWFKTESQLCDRYNLASTPDRKMFCENKTSFKNQTRFALIVVSPDKMKIGFTIESDILPSNSSMVVGIFFPFRITNKIYFLTGYYPENQFISFSPNGMYFIYQRMMDCLELEEICGFFIKDSETLTDKIVLEKPDLVIDPDPELFKNLEYTGELPFTEDFKGENIPYKIIDFEFIKWVSDNEVEYKLGTELKRASF